MLKKGGRATTNEKAAQFLKTYIQIEELIDIWREINPELERFTWYKLRPSTIMVRLDFFLICTPLHQLVNTVGINPGFLSDHSAISLCLSPNKSVRGYGFWKLNNNLLQDAVR